MVLMLSLGVGVYRAYFESIAMIFFAGTLPFPPNNPLLEVFWVIYPLFGLIIIADGITGLSTALRLGDVHSREWNFEVIRMLKDHIILIGIGNVGFKVLLKLIESDKKIVVVDLEDKSGREDEFNDIQAEFRIPVVFGDATREKILMDANIDSASAVLILIDNDLLNIKISLLAKKLNPKILTVIRMFDIEFGNEIKDKLGIDQVISTSTISVPFFLDALNMKKNI